MKPSKQIPARRKRLADVLRRLSYCSHCGLCSDTRVIVNATMWDYVRAHIMLLVEDMKRLFPKEVTRDDQNDRE